VLSFEWNQDDGHEELKLIFEVSLEEKRDEIIKWEALGRGKFPSFIRNYCAAELLFILCSCL